MDISLCREYLFYCYFHEGNSILFRFLSLINKDPTWVNTVLVFEKIKVIGVKEGTSVYNTF